MVAVLSAASFAQQLLNGCDDDNAEATGGVGD